MPDAGRNSCDPRDRRTENVIAQIAVLCASVHTRRAAEARDVSARARARARERARMRFRPCPRVDFRSWINKGISFGARPARYFQDIFRSPFGEYYFSSSEPMWKCQLHSHTWPAEIGIHARARVWVCLKYIYPEMTPRANRPTNTFTAAAPPPAPLRGGVLFSPKLAESQRLIFPRAIKILATSG